MPKKSVLAFILITICQCVLAFDFSAYPLKNVDDIIRQERAADGKEGQPGIKIMSPPPKLSFDGRLESLPAPCNTGFMHQVMKMLGFRPEQLPPIHTCLRVRSAKGEILTVFIQDAVSEYIGKEVKLGEELRLYAMYLYFSKQTQLPMFLVNEFQTGQ